MKRIFTVLMSSLVVSASLAGAPPPSLPAVTLRARPLPLTDVRLTGGPLKRAQDLDAAYLLSLDVDRMMAFLRKSAGLEPKAEGYGGWDGRRPAADRPHRRATTCPASASCTRPPATRDSRSARTTSSGSCKEVQDKQGDGYIGAQADRDGVDAKVRFQELANGVIRSGGFDLNGLWSPWYVLHKIYAGLRDAYRYTGNRDGARGRGASFAAWAEGIVCEAR